jgi:hypothetical protein
MFLALVTATRQDGIRIERAILAGTIAAGDLLDARVERPGVEDWSSASGIIRYSDGSFWWLNAREGSITATRPPAYAFGGSGEGLRLRFPFGFFNDGAKALLLADLRIASDDEAGLAVLRWVTTRDRLRPESDDGFAYPVPFAVLGRSTREVITEFQPSAGLNWSPATGPAHRLRLQGQIHPSDEWIDVVAFEWYAPPETVRSAYIAHRNEPGAPPD